VGVGGVERRVRRRMGKYAVSSSAERAEVSSVDE
jgi:hypothetical protein